MVCSVGVNTFAPQYGSFFTLSVCVGMNTMFNLFSVSDMINELQSCALDSYLFLSDPLSEAFSLNESELESDLQHSDSMAVRLCCVWPGAEGKRKKHVQ